MHLGRKIACFDVSVDRRIEHAIDDAFVSEEKGAPPAGSVPAFRIEAPLLIERWLFEQFVRRSGRMNCAKTPSQNREVALESSLRDHAAKNLRQYLLPSMQLLSEPLGTQEKYLKSDGNFDIEKRFADLESEAPDLMALNPESSFKLADQYSAEQRWLTVGTVLLAISLLWLGLAEVLAGRGRTVNLTLGIGVYLLGLLFFLIVEAIFIIGRGGVL